MPRAGVLAVGLLFCIGHGVARAAEGPPIPTPTIVRYDEDWSGLAMPAHRTGRWTEAFKYIPLDDPGGAYLTTGLEVRLRHETYRDNLWGGAEAPNDSATGIRALPYADLHVGRVRAFVLPIAAYGLGVSPAASPIDQTRRQTGLFFYDNKLHDINQLNLYPSNIQAFRSESRKRTRNIGAFGEATYAFADTTRLTAGLRYDYTRVRNNQDYTSISGVTQSLTGDEGLRKFKNFTYKARLEHDLTPANLLYASISTGFSPGDVAITTDVTSDPVVVELDAQTLTSYEIGSKNRFFGSRLQANGAIYYNDYGGYQTANINVTPDTPENPTFNTIVAPVKVYGAELELLARPWMNGQIGLNMAYTHARYDGIPARYQFLFSTNKIPGAIPFQGNLWLEHGLEIGSDFRLSARGELIYHSAFDIARTTVAQDDAGAGPFVRNSGKILANLSTTLAFANGRYALTGYVRNIGDVRYKANSSVTSAGSGFVSTVDLSEPRTWGLTATARF